MGNFSAAGCAELFGRVNGEAYFFGSRHARYMPAYRAADRDIYTPGFRYNISERRPQPS